MSVDRRLTAFFDAAVEQYLLSTSDRVLGELTVRRAGLSGETAMPIAVAARASGSTMARFPPVAAPRPPGFCTEWVTSNTTGAPDLRISAKLVMSATRLL